MAQETRTTLKGFFNTGDKPTENQFASVIDSVLNLQDTGTQTLSGELSTLDISFSTGSVGITHVTTETAGADAYTYTVHGRRIEVRNKVIADVVFPSSSLVYTVTNNSCNMRSIVVGNLISGSVNAITGSHINILPPIADNTFRFTLNAPQQMKLADGDIFTASFVVL